MGPIGRRPIGRCAPVVRPSGKAWRVFGAWWPCGSVPSPATGWLGQARVPGLRRLSGCENSCISEEFQWFMKLGNQVNGDFWDCSNRFEDLKTIKWSVERWGQLKIPAGLSLGIRMPLIESTLQFLLDYSDVICPVKRWAPTGHWMLISRELCTNSTGFILAQLIHANPNYRFWMFLLADHCDAAMSARIWDVSSASPTMSCAKTPPHGLSGGERTVEAWCPGVHGSPWESMGIRYNVIIYNIYNDIIIYIYSI